MGLLPFTYGRSAYVEKPTSTNTGSPASLHDDGGSSMSLNSAESGGSNGIPPALSFDRILEGGTCPPCTLRDFMNYLLYVERSAENLQFFLWHRDYERRFAAAKTADLALAPEWTQAMEDKATMRIKKDQAEKMRKSPKGTSAIFKGTDFERSIDSREELITPATPVTPIKPVTPTDRSRSLASQAFASAGVKDPFTIQPFRKELDRVIATYLMDDAPRQLNLSEVEQKATLQALARTTHPSALGLAARQTEAALRQLSHPAFVRWSVCNASPSRVCTAWGTGSGTALAGLLAAVLLALSGAARGYRALAALPWVMGFATMMGAYKGMCLLLHGFHHRHIRPWELFISDLDDDEDAISATKRSFDSFGSANSYEDEPWVVRYQRRSFARKVFDRTVWVEEPALRQIQDVIFVQSTIFGVVCAAVLTGVFVAVPAGGFF